MKKHRQHHRNLYITLETPLIIIDTSFNLLYRQLFYKVRLSVQIGVQREELRKLRVFCDQNS
jgi:hypothetical protein